MRVRRASPPDPVGAVGIDSLVLDRWANVYPQPRAVHLDDEIYRVVARLGIAEEFARDLPTRSRPATAGSHDGRAGCHDADLDQWDGVHQVCDPVRAGTYMRIGLSRYRWEFRLLPGESADDFRSLQALKPLIAPWTSLLSGTANSS